MAKSTFQRVGTNLNLDWQNLQKVRIRGGNSSPGGHAIRLDQFAMYGGSPIGIGFTSLRAKLRHGQLVR